MHTYIHTYPVMSQRIYWISQKCFYSNGVVGFKRPHFKILTKSEPIAIMRRWASLKQTKSTFQRLPVQNNIQLGCHQLNLEQSPHIPYDETGGWNGIGKIWVFSLWRSSLDWRQGMESDYQGLHPIWRKSDLELHDQTGLRLELIAMSPWRTEDKHWKDR